MLSGIDLRYECLREPYADLLMKQSKISLDMSEQDAIDVAIEAETDGVRIHAISLLIKSHIKSGLSPFLSLKKVLEKKVEL